MHACTPASKTQHVRVHLCEEDAQDTPTPTYPPAHPHPPAPTRTHPHTQIYASEADCQYTLYCAQGTWRKKDYRHLPGSLHSCDDCVKWHPVR